MPLSASAASRSIQAVWWKHVGLFLVVSCKECELYANYRIIESFRLEKNFKITESNHKPNTAKSTTKQCP